ncbi:MAG: HAMP domain-containing histidine kinase [bacterium]|nr:HAMP domain-containing histidine kinase [bacterium]
MTVGPDKTPDQAARSDSNSASPENGAVPAQKSYSLDEVRDYIRQIESGLTKVLFGDYTAVIKLEDADPMWGNLAMHVNVVINAARNAITRAETSEREAAVARDRAIAAADAESQFLTNVTHELRTPMASIKASAEILRDYGQGDPDVLEEFLGVMISESDRLTRLIENVLTLGKMQADETSWQVSEARIDDLCDEAVTALRPLALNLGSHLHLTVGGEIPGSFMDCDGIKQVVINVVSNALKFSPRGGVVEVEVAHDKGEGELVVEVRDQGPGIPPDELESIFERFRQVTSDILTDKPSGTGLGLAIAREIVNHHGGRIGAESTAGQGSTFRVQLPVLRTQSEFAKLQATMAAASVAAVSD